jgi:hypothetical protein
MTPYDRRMTLVERRHQLLFGQISSTNESTKESEETEVDGQGTETQQENDEPDAEEKYPVKPASGVTVKTDCPTENELRNANELTRQCTRGDEILVLGNGILEIHKSNGEYRIFEHADLEKDEFFRRN